MAYVNNGSSRNMTMIVGRAQDGIETVGYPKIYSILAAFTAPETSTLFPFLTETQYQRLSQPEFQTRLDAFEKYVKTQEDGIAAGVPDLTAGAYNPVSLKCSLAGRD